MSILVTGASGYIGSVVAEKLRGGGHQVVGLARSEAAARKLEAAMIEVRRGSLEDQKQLAAAARETEGVVHAAMSWDADTALVDRRAVETITDALSGTNKPFIYTSGVWVMGSTGGRLAGEYFPLNPPPLVAWRPQVERIVLDATERKVRGVVIRPAVVYGRGGGFLSAWASGKMPVVGDGENQWSFVHVDDLADLYALALERAQAGSIYLGVEGNAQKVKDVATALGIVSFLPLEEARKTMGPLADALCLDQKVGSTKAFRELGWRPSRPGVLEEMRTLRAK